MPSMHTLVILIKKWSMLFRAYMNASIVAGHPDLDYTGPCDSPVYSQRPVIFSAEERIRRSVRKWRC
jgi:hypothetical protein